MNTRLNPKIPRKERKDAKKPKISKVTLAQISNKKSSLVVPTFNILLKGAIIGRFTRGHIRLYSKKGTRIFSRVFRLIENFEREQFAQGKFEAYKTAFTKKFFKARDKPPYLEAFLKRQKKEVHIDYSVITIVSALLVSRGYTIIRESRKELEALGLPKNADSKQIINFLNSNPQLNYQITLFFIKPVKGLEKLKRN